MVASAAIVPVSAKDTGMVCAIAFDAVTSSTEAGSSVPAGDALLGFDVETPLSPGDLLRITFPSGTSFAASLQASDVLVQQASDVLDPSCTTGKDSGQPANAESLLATGSGTDTPTLVLGIDPVSLTSGGQGGRSGAGRITLSINASSSQTIIHPRSDAIGELRIETQKAGGSIVNAGSLGGIVFAARSEPEATVEEPTPTEEPVDDEPAEAAAEEPAPIEEPADEGATIVEEPAIVPAPETPLLAPEPELPQVAEEPLEETRPSISLIQSNQSLSDVPRSVYELALPTTEPGSVFEVGSALASDDETDVVDRLVLTIDPGLGAPLTDFTLKLETEFADPASPTGEVDVADLAARTTHDSPSLLVLHVTAVNRTSSQLNDVVASLDITFRVPFSYFATRNFDPGAAHLLEYHDADNDGAGEFVRDIPLADPKIDGSSYVFQQDLFEFSSFVLVADRVPPISIGCSCSWGAVASLPSVSVEPVPLEVDPAPPVDEAPQMPADEVPAPASSEQPIAVGVPAAIVNAQPTPDLTATVGIVGGVTMLGLLFLSLSARAHRPTPSLARRVRAIRSLQPRETPSLGRRLVALRNA
jgi:hypothetical protein